MLEQAVVQDPDTSKFQLSMGVRLLRCYGSRSVWWGEQVEACGHKHRPASTLPTFLPLALPLTPPLCVSTLGAARPATALGTGMEVGHGEGRQGLRSFDGVLTAAQHVRCVCVCWCFYRSWHSIHSYYSRHEFRLQWSAQLAYRQSPV